MLLKYLHQIFRKILRNGDFSLINIIGLSVGLAGCLISAQYILFEWSYDGFHPGAERIFRIQNDKFHNGEITYQNATTYYGAGPAMKADYPEVEQFVRLYNYGNHVVTHGSNRFKENKIFCADPAFFRVFAFPLVAGTLQGALAEPNTVFLSETTARKYFGGATALDQVITLQYMSSDPKSYQVKGVFRDVPANSHFQFDFLVPFPESFKGIWEDSKKRWSSGHFYTYIQLVPGARPANLEANLPRFIERYRGDMLKADNATEKFYLQPVADIHLNSNLGREIKPPGDKKIVYSLAIVSCFILVIAWINYVNLSMAQAFKRAKEIGIRKAMGATRADLMVQFFFESGLLILLSGILSLVLVQCLTFLLHRITGQPVVFLQWQNPQFWAMAGGLLVAGAFFAGLYPAVILSSFGVVRAVKGEVSRVLPGLSLRKVLVMVQFSFALTLFIGTFVLYRQLHYMRHQDLGIDMERVVVVKAPDLSNTDSVYIQRTNALRSELLSYPDIQSIASSGAVPGSETWSITGSIRRAGATVPNKGDTYSMVWVDYEFLRTFGLKLMNGRYFSPVEDPANQENVYRKVVVNEAAARLLGFRNPKEAVSQSLVYEPSQYQIIGVIGNYHQQSLRSPHIPMIFFLKPVNNYYLSLKIDGKNIASTVDLIRTKYEQAYAGYPFDYFFLSEYFNNQYQSDESLGRLFIFFSLLCIWVACMGLFGLSSLLTQQKSKEIGIRKALGASLSSILLLLTREYLIILLAANVLVWPLAYFLTNKWLANYAFHIQVGWSLFLVPCIIVLIIAIGAVSYYTLKTARLHPSRTLRSE